MTFVKLHKPSIAYRTSGFAIGHHTPVRVVLHDTESGNLHDPGLADLHGVIDFWRKTPLPNRLGSQFVVDSHGQIAQTARATELTQHVGGLNTGSIGIEQIGYASLTHDEWMGRKMQLEKVARLLAFFHARYHIPLEHGRVNGCGDAGAGVITHADVSKVCAESEGHTDPGPNYPFDHVIARARFIAQRGGWEKM
jgi:N-acetyl-anhydromuramyl-L-alanine amidase AmpD